MHGTLSRCRRYGRWLGGYEMPTAKYYEERAADCLKVAEATNDPAAKAILLEMAQAWRKLAEHRRSKEREDHGSAD